MDRFRFIELLRKKEAGEISLAERKELLDFTSKNENYRDILRTVESLGSKYSNFNKKEAEQTEEELKKLNEKIRQSTIPALKKAKILKLNFLRYAAAVVVMALVSAYLIISFGPGNKNSKQSVLTTLRGSKSSIRLPDGTLVWINSDTRLTYDESFGKNNREVTLSGEAYFDVIKDKNHPFIVRTKTMDVKVLGTAFNVRAYADEMNTSTTLVRGRVEIILKKKSGEKITLSPNEKLVVHNEKTNAINSDGTPEMQLLSVRSNLADSSLTETQWVKNKLVFEQEKLANMVPVLERWYNVEIEIKNSYNDAVYLNGTFENDSLDDVLQSLKVIAGFNYKIEDHKVIIF